LADAMLPALAQVHEIGIAAEAGGIDEDPFAVTVEIHRGDIDPGHRTGVQRTRGVGGILDAGVLGEVIERAAGEYRERKPLAHSDFGHSGDGAVAAEDAERADLAGAEML